MHEWNSLGISYRHRPLGNSHHFLYQKQSARARAMKSASENNYQTIITGYSSCPKDRVNFKPQKTWPDAFSECLNERYAKKKKKSNSNHRNYRGIWLPILNNYNNRHSHGFLLRREFVEILVRNWWSCFTE